MNNQNEIDPIYEARWRCGHSTQKKIEFHTVLRYVESTRLSSLMTLRRPRWRSSLKQQFKLNWIKVVLLFFSYLSFLCKLRMREKMSESFGLKRKWNANRVLSCDLTERARGDFHTVNFSYAWLSSPPPRSQVCKRRDRTKMWGDLATAAVAIWIWLFLALPSQPARRESPRRHIYARRATATREATQQRKTVEKHIYEKRDVRSTMKDEKS